MKDFDILKLHLKHQFMYVASLIMIKALHHQSESIA